MSTKQQALMKKIKPTNESPKSYSSHVHNISMNKDGSKYTRHLKMHEDRSK